MKNGIEVLEQAGSVGMKLDEVTQFAMAEKNAMPSAADLASEQAPVTQPPVAQATTSVKPEGKKTKLAADYLRNQQQQRALQALPAWMDFTDFTLADAKYHVNALYFHIKVLGTGLVLILCLLMVMMWLMLGQV